MLKLNREDHNILHKISREIHEKGKFSQTQNHLHHKHTSVYEHVHRVARTGLWLNRKFHLGANPEYVARSSLLHDYFQYDWHDANHDHPRPHGFHHPKVALENARKDFRLHPREENAILRHMFPLTVIPPRHREGWIVTISDKLSTVREMFKKR